MTVAPILCVYCCKFVLHFLPYKKIYAPEDDKDCDACERVVYVFICKRASCHDSTKSRYGFILFNNEALKLFDISKVIKWQTPSASSPVACVA